MSEWNATDYHSHSRLQEVLAQQHLSWLPLEGWERVLDVGCGDGKITAALAARLPRGSAVGVDPSTQMVAYASGNYDPAKYPNLSFRVGDARDLPFSAEFDRAVSFNALHWVHEGDAALRSIRRALVGGGRAFLEFVPAGKPSSTDYLVGEVCRSPRWAGYFAGFRDPFAHFAPDEYRSMAERAGFAVERIETEEASWDFGDREGFLGFLRTTTYGWTERLPEAERPAFYEDCLNRYAEANGTDRVLRFLQMEVALRAA
ncbi:MAG: class I SAM-dependent methyltransferase [Gemmataceae bacterium]